MHITEDFPKEVLEFRKELKAKQKEEQEKGNTAFIRYDKLRSNKTQKKKEELHDHPIKRKNRETTAISKFRVVDLLKKQEQIFSFVQQVEYN